MQIALFVVGRMKKGPEQDLAKRYLERFSKAAPPLGLSFYKIHEISESREKNAKQRMEEEGEKLLAFLPENSPLIVLDERGKSLTSPQFASEIAHFRDNGNRHLTIALGGADGHSEKVRARANILLAFGAMTWPHQIARILLTEQLYRAVTILSGHPYHRI